MFWEFVTSSGFGGVAAVVAATIAFLAAGRTSSRARRTAVEQQWWQNVRWLVDRIEGELTDDGFRATVDALALMGKQAPGTEESLYVQRILEVLSGSLVDAGEGAAEESVNDDVGGNDGAERQEPDDARPSGGPASE